MAPSPFGRAVEALVRAHRLALILLVGPNDRAHEAREQLAKLLPPHLHARSYRIDRQGPDLLSCADSLGDPFPILFVHGFERLHPQQREDVEIRLNLLRDAFAQHHLGLIFWLPRDTLESFLQHCPDLFAWRSLLAEVDDAALPISPIIAARREYLSRLLRQIRLPEMLVEMQVATDRPSLLIDFQEWAVKTRRGLAVGEAGSGKTTALQTLAHRLADHAYDDPTQPVPVLLQGEAFSRSLRFDTDGIWPRGVDLELPLDVLSTLAETGQLILLLDGLDEVPRDMQGPLLDWLIRLSNMYPLLRVIVMSRDSTAFRLTASSPEWEVVQMQALTHGQASKIRSRIQHLYLLDRVDRDRLEDSFVLNHRGSGHPSSEGQRGLALDSVRFLSYLVDRRLKDFDEATSRYRGIGHARRADVLGYRDVRRALQRMALAAMVAGTPRISRHMLLSSFSGVPGLFSTQAVHENAEYLLVSRSGLLLEDAGDFAFVHMSLQEYLAAECLEELGPEKALEILEAHLADERWTKVVADTAALLEMRYSTGQKLLDRLAEHALRIPEEKPRAAAFAILLTAALAVDVWSEGLGSVLQSARLTIQGSSDATDALEPIVGEAMRLHGKAD